jgi:polyisoprenoid-binding protein YceI
MPKAVYHLDPAHSSAHFSVRHMMISNVRGEFSRLSGAVVFDPQNPAASSIEAQIETASINTSDAKRDAHLRSADFFDAEKYPSLTFRSTRLARTEAGWTVEGDLTIHGVTRPVTLDVEGPTPEVKDPWGSGRIGATASAKLNRKDFGLTWNTPLETGGFLVGDEIRITLEIEAIRQAVAAA